MWKLKKKNSRQTKNFGTPSKRKQVRKKGKTPKMTYLDVFDPFNDLRGQSLDPKLAEIKFERFLNKNFFMTPKKTGGKKGKTPKTTYYDVFDPFSDLHGHSLDPKLVEIKSERF